MKNDLSYLLYEKYYNLNNPIIEIVMKNNEVLKGGFHGFFKGDTSKNEPYIIKWHFVEEDSFFGIGLFEELIGHYIYQSEIKCIKFLEDGSSINF